MDDQLATCRMCKATFPFHRGNKLYCDKCNELMTRASYRWKCGNATIWVRHGMVLRAVIDGKETTPIREAKEFGEWCE